MKENRSSLLICVLAIWILSGTGLVLAEPVLEHLATVPSKLIESIHIRNGVPEEIILGTENMGGYCGGGTPASIWKVYIDPSTGQVQSTLEIQTLSAIQNIRHAIAESSDGTLFTGGGWCGYKPPYYSTDGGDHWTTADTGDIHPPNSTFSYVEFNDEIYAGTGYEPYPGEVYRWLGSGNWERVFTFPSPSRSIVNSLQAHNGNLFAGSLVYGWYADTCSESNGIYVSSDGQTFNPTTGIPSCDTVFYMYKVGQNLLALTKVVYSTSQDKTHIYRWEGQAWSHLGTTGFIWNDTDRPVVVDNGFIYSFGRPSESAINGIYRSYDLGLTWQFVVSQETPLITTLHVHDNFLFAGTGHDTNQYSHLYRMDLTEVCNLGDINCDDDNNRDDVDIVKSFRNQPASVCRKCDLDFDGRITILDMRKIITTCACPLCVCP
jgi:hypothetical protein